MERPVFLVLLFGIAALLMAFFFGGVQWGEQATWSPRNYVTKGNDCFVPPQGDPLYDEHYAKNVNAPNCQAFVAQAQAKQITEETRAIKWETNYGVIGVVAIFVILGLLAFLFLVFILRG